MPVSKPSELPKGGGGRWPLCGAGFRSERWGDMEIGYTTCDPGDHSELYEGLPGGVCPCPHYGYVFRGHVRARYPGTDWPDEVAETGDAFFFPAGHLLSYDEPTECLELNPAGALQVLMDHIEAKAQAMVDAMGEG